MDTRRLRRLRHNPDAPVRFSSGEEAERAALAARGAVLANPEFRAWFGRSKVVDADGKPLVVYHGTQSVFTAFGLDLSLFGGSGRKMSPTWFSESPEHAGYFAREAGFARGSVMPVYLSIERPLVVRKAPAAGWNEEEKEKVLKRAKRGSHDGIIFTDMQDLDAGRATTYVVFGPTQIKSATGNRGTFDPEEADIRHNPLRRGLSRPLSRPARRLRRNPEDAGHILDLMDRLEEFKSSVMEAAGDDPYETTFDPMEYPIDSDTLRSYLDARILGWGASRIAVLLPSGNVAKLPWSDMVESNVREWERWQEASPEVQQMLLPPLEMVSGTIVFPRASTVSDRDYDDPELAAARARWKALWLSGAPGAEAEDIQNTQNWGIYEGRVVLIDYAD